LRRNTFIDCITNCRQIPAPVDLSCITLRATEQNDGYCRKTSGRKLYLLLFEEEQLPACISGRLATKPYPILFNCLYPALFLLPLVYYKKSSAAGAWSAGLYYKP